MANSTYQINKGINKSIVFKGLRAQYIWYMGGGMFLLLIIYALMYLVKINTYISLGVTICLGAVMIVGIYHLSGTYGEHGLSKALAKRNIPKVVKSNSRRPFRKK
jgi:hypothetical protein